MKATAIWCILGAAGLTFAMSAWAIPYPQTSDIPSLQYDGPAERLRVIERYDRTDLPTKVTTVSNPGYHDGRPGVEIASLYDTDYEWDWVNLYGYEPPGVTWGPWNYFDGGHQFETEYHLEIVVFVFDSPREGEGPHWVSSWSKTWCNDPNTYSFRVKYEAPDASSTLWLLLCGVAPLARWHRRSLRAVRPR